MRFSPEVLGFLCEGREVLMLCSSPSPKQAMRNDRCLAPLPEVVHLETDVVCPFLLLVQWPPWVIDLLMSLPCFSSSLVIDSDAPLELITAPG